MLSVVIETSNEEDLLARTLGALVPAAVEGVVLEVLVHDLGSTDQSVIVADHAGCRIVPQGELLAALKRAKGDWLLLLEPGARLGEGWMEEAMAHVSRAAMPARFRRARTGPSRFLPTFFSRSRPLADGLLVSRRQAIAQLKPGAGVEELARGLSGKRLNAEIAPGERRKKKR